jgi:hypothetical protein
MKNQLLELIAIRVMESGNTSGSMEQFEIDEMFYDVDYSATIETKAGMKSGSYDVPNDKDALTVELHKVDIRNVWDKDGEMLEADKLKQINNQFYIL